MFPLRDIQPHMHDVYMRMALEEAEAAAEQDEVPVGAVVICNGRAIGKGHNLTQTLTDVTAHAEMQAITAASDWLGGKYLTDCVMYVTVEPCIMCAGALGWAQIGGVVFGASDPKRGFMSYYGSKAPSMPSPLHRHTQVLGGVLEKDCMALMQTFFRSKRK